MSIYDVKSDENELSAKKLTEEAIKDLKNTVTNAMPVPSEKSHSTKPVIIFCTLLLLCLSICSGLAALVSPWLSAGAVVVLGALLLIIRERILPSSSYSHTSSINMEHFVAGAREALKPLEEMIISREMHSGEQTTIENELNSAKTKLAYSERLIDTLENENESQKTEIDELNATIRDLQSGISTLIRDDSMQKKEINELKITVATQTEKIKQLTAELEKKPLSTAPTVPNTPDEAAKATDFPDISSEGFARWLQNFSIITQRKNDHDLNNLYPQLKFELKRLGICIYDTLEYDTNGNVLLPDKSYFQDWREGDEWTKVTMPIIHTKDKLLIKGKIM